MRRLLARIRPFALVAGFGSAVFALGLGSVPRADDSGAFDHQAWNAVLSQFVDQRGRVDYETLAGDRAALDRYLAQIAETGPQSTPERFPTASHELAYYVNAYNALVFQGVLDGDLDGETVWRGLVPGYSFFVGRKFRLDGRSINLRKLENELVRARFGDARVHAALNCASVGCPRLPTTAFSPGHLERELNSAMTEFVSSEQNVRIDDANRTVFLSKIFEWYREDFLADERETGNAEPNLIGYVNRFRGDASPIPRDYAVRFLEYDKRLNRQPDHDDN
jgi:hypothetical protein